VTELMKNQFYDTVNCSTLIFLFQADKKVVF